MLAIVLLLEQYRVSHFTPYTNWKLCCCFWLFSSPCNNRYKLYCWEVASSCLESVPLCVPQCSWWEHPVFLSFQYMRASACQEPGSLSTCWVREILADAWIYKYTFGCAPNSRDLLRKGRPGLADVTAQGQAYGFLPHSPSSSLPDDLETVALDIWACWKMAVPLLLEHFAS